MSQLQSSSVWFYHRLISFYWHCTIGKISLQQSFHFFAILILLEISSFLSNRTVPTSAHWCFLFKIVCINMFFWRPTLVTLFRPCSVWQEPNEVRMKWVIILNKDGMKWLIHSRAWFFRFILRRKELSFEFFCWIFYVIGLVRSIMINEFF